MAHVLHFATSTAALGILILGCSRDAAETATATSTARPAIPSVDHTSAKQQDGAEAARTDRGGPAVPNGYVPVTVAGIGPTPRGSAVLLVDNETRRVVPIFVGGSEALTIELRLEHRRFGRPLTHDLLDVLLRTVGGNVRTVRIDELKDGVFHATVVVVHEGHEHEIDARSSDAVAMALGHGVPIHLAEAVLVQAGVSLDALQPPPAPDGGQADGGNAEPTAGMVTL